jgi:hypothetical protein
MTTAKRLVIAVLCLAAALAAGSVPAAAAPADPKETVLAAYANLNALKNYHLAMAQEITMTVGEQRTTMLTAIESDLQAKPLLCRNVVTLTFGSDTKKNRSTALQYIEKEGDQFAVYTLANNKWVKQYLPFFDPYAEYDHFFRAVKSVTLLRDYTATAVYEVTIDGRYFGQTIERTFTALSGRKIAIPEETLAGIGDIAYTIAIDKTAAIPARIEIDMSAPVAYIAEKILLADLPAGQNTTLRQMLTGMRATVAAAFSRPNAVGKIAIPPEALAAPLAKNPAPGQTTGKE